MKLTSKNLKPLNKRDKLLNEFLERSVNERITRNYEQTSITYEHNDGLPKPRITKNDLESWS